MSTKWTFICNIENLSKVTLWVSFEPYRSAFMCLLFWCIIFSANFRFLHRSAVHFQKRKATQHIKYFPLLGILRNSPSRSKGSCICSGAPSSWNDFHSCMRSLLMLKVLPVTLCRWTLTHYFNSVLLPSPIICFYLRTAVFPNSLHQALSSTLASIKV